MSESDFTYHGGRLLVDDVTVPYRSRKRCTAAEVPDSRQHVDRLDRLQQALALSPAKANAWAEFLCGPVGIAEVDAVHALFQEVAPYTVADAEMTARLFNTGGRRRGTLADCMIAAVALRAGAALATSNLADFKRFASESLTLVGA